MFSKKKRGIKCVIEFQRLLWQYAPSKNFLVKKFNYKLFKKKISALIPLLLCPLQRAHRLSVYWGYLLFLTCFGILEFQVLQPRRGGGRQFAHPKIFMSPVIFCYIPFAFWLCSVYNTWWEVSSIKLYDFIITFWNILVKKKF